LNQEEAMTTPLKAAANRDDGSDEEGITGKSIGRKFSVSQRLLS
jgi:hypothetical protein